MRKSLSDDWFEYPPKPAKKLQEYQHREIPYCWIMLVGDSFGRIQIWQRRSMTYVDNDQMGVL